MPIKTDSHDHIRDGIDQGHKDIYISGASIIPSITVTHYLNADKIPYHIRSMFTPQQLKKMVDENWDIEQIADEYMWTHLNKVSDNALYRVRNAIENAFVMKSPRKKTADYSSLEKQVKADLQKSGLKGTPFNWEAMYSKADPYELKREGLTTSTDQAKVPPTTLTVDMIEQMVEDFHKKVPPMSKVKGIAIAVHLIRYIGETKPELAKDLLRTDFHVYTAMQEEYKVSEDFALRAVTKAREIMLGSRQAVVDAYKNSTSMKKMMKETKEQSARCEEIRDLMNSNLSNEEIATLKKMFPQCNNSGGMPDAKEQK